MPPRLPVGLLSNQALNQSAGQQWLSATGVVDTQRGLTNLELIVEKTPARWVEPLLLRLQEQLPVLSDPDRGLNNLERFVVSHSKQEMEKLLQNGEFELSWLLRLFSDSQFASDLLAQDRDCLALLQRDSTDLVSREILVDHVRSLLADTNDSSQAMAQLRLFKQRQTVRIACSDLIHDCRLEQIIAQISFLAEAICQGAYEWSRRRLIERWGMPRTPAGTPTSYVILAMGKLGGSELNYSSDIDLVMVYGTEGKTRGARSRTNREFFEQLTRDIVRMLGESTVAGQIYRVDLRLRPEGSRGKICSSMESLLRYYDFQGRTWETPGVDQGQTHCWRSGFREQAYEGTDTLDLSP